MDASNINARIHLHELYSTNKRAGFLGFLNNALLKGYEYFRNWLRRWLFLDNQRG